MPLPYEIRSNITRQSARDLVTQLIEDDDFRERFERDTLAVLSENGIEVAPESLPEVVTLPDKEAIQDLLSLVETRIAPEAASPFGFLLLIIAFGAMPVLIGDRSALDGTG